MSLSIMFAQFFVAFIYDIVVQMAVMAKKWKMRSNTEEINKTSSKVLSL